MEKAQILIVEFGALGSEWRYRTLSSGARFEVLFVCGRAEPGGHYAWERLPCWGVHAGKRGFHLPGALLRAVASAAGSTWVVCEPPLLMLVRLARRRRQLDGSTAHARRLVVAGRSAVPLQLAVGALRRLGYAVEFRPIVDILAGASAAPAQMDKEAA